MFIVGRIGLGTCAASYRWIAGFTQVSKDVLLMTVMRNGGIECMSGDGWEVVNHRYRSFDQCVIVYPLEDVIQLVVLNEQLLICRLLWNCRCMAIFNDICVLVVRTVS
jgi:hypothetical protein